MAVFNEPTKWAQSLGATANADVIPDEAGEMDVDISKIFPAVFSIPLSQGGKAIPRRTLNGLFKTLGDWSFYAQNGGIASYDEAIDYVVGRVVLHDGNIYLCTQSSNSENPHSPVDANFWSKITTIADVASDFATIKLDNVSADSIFNLQNCDLSEQEITETLHNNIFRGYNLLNYFADLDELQTAVASGDFSKIYIGDYVEQTITYSGTQYTTKYRVAGINTFKNYGDSALTRNHLVLIPDLLFDAQMNTSNTTSGGYVGSRMYTTVLPALLTSFAGSSSTPFFGKIISHRELFQTGEDAWSWYDNSLCLLSEIEVYGSRIFGNTGRSQSFYAQMPLFKLNPDYISKFNHHNVWLRSVSSSADFCVAAFYGGAGPLFASSGSSGVRPRFLFG